ncbi:MAG: GHKL domain-containing protein [Polyangiaceae bacterium]|nr:GHKL domain-containing protein [Polyangiaceae bacterium]
MPATWFEELLDLALSVPVDRGAPAVATHCLDVLSRLLPSLAVGACLVRPNASEPLIVTRVPTGSHAGEGRDPTRLFPAAATERVFRVDDTTGGSTLHLAIDDTASIANSTACWELARRGARVLGVALQRANAFQQARDSRAEFERLQAHVIQAEKLASLGQIVAGVVHELNNPLTSIVAYSDYLKKKMLSSGDAGDAERLQRISEAAERILKFSRDLVAYSRPASGIPGPVQLEDVVEKAVVFCEHEFTQNRVQVEREYDAVVPPVRGVAGQLTQVFVNLFTNAAHAMSRSGGRLRITMHKSPTPGTVLVRVSDEGVGIAPGDFDRIFEPFFTTKADGRGAGLGLSIVSDIVAAHGGTLDAQSSVGEGSVFSVTLPLAAMGVDAAEPE